MGQDTYDTDTMSFNFKTKKGFIKHVYTKQEDGFLTSEQSKRNDNGEIYLAHGRYTTCDAPHPDFYIALSRAKVRPGKDVVFVSGLFGSSRCAAAFRHSLWLLPLHQELFQRLHHANLW